MIIVRGLVLLALSGCGYAEVQTLGEMGMAIAGSFGSISKLIIATAYISGIGFGIAAIFKFKQVKDNPTQIPISTPFALLAVSALLVFLPGVFVPAGLTLFGADAIGADGKKSDATGTVAGVCIQGLPGCN